MIYFVLICIFIFKREICTSFRVRGCALTITMADLSAEWGELCFSVEPGSGRQVLGSQITNMKGNASQGEVSKIRNAYLGQILKLWRRCV